MREIIRRINALMEDMEPRLTALRRSVHQYPETGWLEMRTSAIIHERLSALGYTVLTGGKAVSPEARMGVPDAETLSAHAKAVEKQAGTPLSYLTDEMRQGLTGVIGILNCGPGPVAALRFDIDALPMM